MKKIRVFLISATMLLAIAGAFATRQQQACLYFPQYVPFLGTFVPAGQYGSDYVCYSSYGTCTWYKPNPWTDYQPCRQGLFFRVYR